MIEAAVGFAAGVGCVCAYWWRTQRLLASAKAEAGRALDGARERAGALQEELERTQAQLTREREQVNMRRIRECAWSEGYDEGLRDGESRQAARQFTTQFESGNPAVMMIRKGRA